MKYIKTKELNGGSVQEIYQGENQKRILTKDKEKRVKIDELYTYDATGDHSQDVLTRTWYYKDGKTKAIKYYKDNKLHSDEGPAVIEYNQDGTIKKEECYKHGTLV